LNKNQYVVPNIASWKNDKDAYETAQEPPQAPIAEINTLSIKLLYKMDAADNRQTTPTTSSASAW